VPELSLARILVFGQFDLRSCSPLVLSNKLVDGYLYIAIFLLFPYSLKEGLDQAFLGLALKVAPASALHYLFLIEREIIEAVGF
jgi:hypothetical protein